MCIMDTNTILRAVCLRGFVESASQHIILCHPIATRTLRLTYTQNESLQWSNGNLQYNLYPDIAAQKWHDTRLLHGTKRGSGLSLFNMCKKVLDYFSNVYRT